MVGVPLPYDDLDELRGRLAELSPALVAYGDVQDNNYFAQATQLSQVTKLPTSKIGGMVLNKKYEYVEPTRFLLRIR